MHSFVARSMLSMCPRITRPMMRQEPRPAPRVLVVDDEPRIAQLVAEVLKAEGYDVDTAANGLLALEQI